MLAYSRTDRGAVLIARTGPRAAAVIAIRETIPLVGPPVREETRHAVSLEAEGEITALAIDNRGNHAYVGTSTGRVLRIDLGAPDGARVSGALDATSRPGVGVSALGLLLGDRTLLVGDAAGAVSSWLILPEEPAGLRRAQSFESHPAAVIGFAPSARDKGFFSADGGGTIRLHYATTGNTLLSVRHPAAAVRALAYPPKADGLLAIDTGGRLAHWEVHNPHPQAALGSLFGKTLYEGYREPAFVWQSTGATDDFEEKLSLTPLIYGTLKGTFYAMLLAVPLAILGALYASQFMHPTLKGLIKPVIEIMAALPSVVLGFLAGLWLAPMIERIVPAIFLFPLVVCATILLAAALWRLAPAGVRGRLRPGTEVVVLAPVVVASGWFALRLGGLVESTLLGGDYRGWLLSVLGLTYDQRNSLVVGFAMGFAVIPIIFTIAEDALSNVPPYLSAGSLALGATRWQTAIRVVLPTASPGIFSALMIGLGRAVGETMIVLMATGNTPLMDWSVFNGFRALSANIAVELPEAPQGGTLYRVLFLAAFLLFVMTFIVNTAAEVVRLRLRRRYQAL
jgi:phosphate transport system permease protein